MSEEKKQIYTGGPAFPLNWEDRKEFWGFGLSVRDYFAAKAMHAILSNPEFEENDNQLATYAYNVADAMLKARDK